MIKPQAIIAYVLKKENDEWKYLLLRRSGKYLAGNWQMVTGGLEGGEITWQGALREIHEETGLRPTRFYTADALEVFYVASQDQIMMNPAFVAFIDDEQKIILSDHEHDAFQWVSYDQALDILEFAEQKRILTHVHQHFALQAPSKRFLITPI